MIILFLFTFILCYHRLFSEWKKIGCVANDRFTFTNTRRSCV